MDGTADTPLMQTWYPSGGGGEGGCVKVRYKGDECMHIVLFGGNTDTYDDGHFMLMLPSDAQGKIRSPQ